MNNMDTPIDMKVSVMEIVTGEYIYTSKLPKGCKGHSYLVHRMVVQVPSYQRQILIEALTGPDTGMWFCCSPSYFASRYKLAGNEINPDPIPQVENKEIDNTHKGPGY